MAEKENKKKFGWKEAALYTTVVAGGVVMASGCAANGQNRGVLGELLHDTNIGKEIDAFGRNSEKKLAAEIGRLTGNSAIGKDVAGFLADKTTNFANSVVNNAQAMTQEQLNKLGKGSQPQGNSGSGQTAAQILNGQNRIDVDTSGSYRNKDFQVERRKEYAWVARKNADVDAYNLRTMEKNIYNQWKLKDLQELAAVDSMSNQDVAQIVQSTGMLVEGVTPDYQKKLAVFKQYVGEKPDYKGVRRGDVLVPCVNINRNDGQQGAWVPMRGEFYNKARELNRFNFSQNDAGQQRDSKDIPCAEPYTQEYASADNSALKYEEAVVKAKGVDAPGEYIIASVSSGLNSAKEKAGKALSAAAGKVKDTAVAVKDLVLGQGQGQERTA
jgi:hypothetical protein